MPDRASAIGSGGGSVAQPRQCLVDAVHFVPRLGREAARPLDVRQRLRVPEQEYGKPRNRRGSWPRIRRLS
eukprot:3952108-Alexandrium_andersonii.AAC.1